MKIVRFHLEAERELQDATTWYNHQRKGLGAEFFLCLDESISRIIDNPLLYPIVHENIRRAVVVGFHLRFFMK